MNGVWQNEIQMNDTCEGLASVCIDSYQRVDSVANTNNQRPFGYTLRNSTECTKCGGDFDRSFFNFQSFRWVQSRYIKYRWIERAWVSANKWGGTIDTAKFAALHARAVARRYSSILQANILCRYGQSSQLLTQIACNCGANSRDGCFSSTQKQVTSVVYLCSFIQNTVTVDSVTLRATKLQFDSVDCDSLTLYQIPLEQFIGQQAVSINSIVLSQSKLRGQRNVIWNENNVAIGSLMGSGLQISMTANVLRGLQICFVISDNSSSTDLEADSYDIGIANDDFSSFTILGLDVDASQSEICFDYNLVTNRAVFPVKLIKDWRTAAFIDGLLTEERVLIFVGVALYIIALSIAVFFVTQQIRNFYRAGKKILVLSTMGLSLITLALLLRILFLFLLPFGVFEAVQSSSIIFSELPALVYLICYAIVVYRWVVLYHFKFQAGANSKGFKRLRPVILAFIALLCLAFIIILIAFLSIPVQPIDQCVVQSTNLGARDIIAIVYKVFFAIVCIGLSIVFLIYGIRIVLISNSFKVIPLNQEERQLVEKRKTQVKTRIAITIIGALCLIGQAANLLRSIGPDPEETSPS